MSEKVRLVVWSCSFRQWQAITRVGRLLGTGCWGVAMISVTLLADWLSLVSARSDCELLERKELLSMFDEFHQCTEWPHAGREGRSVWSGSWFSQATASDLILVIDGMREVTATAAAEESWEKLSRLKRSLLRSVQCSLVIIEQWQWLYWRAATKW